jgi:hypothetical protein
MLALYRRAVAEGVPIINGFYSLAKAAVVHVEQYISVMDAKDTDARTHGLGRV